ncbi:hypothetical protein RHODO2019_18530 (plasmid) [Rhodococcus antarcticus]|uniref:Uncharacterized protein n=1 Tax=Rhodococcus antarcticus TaxID=2987751 RepID=A0ABY6P692_9NOCA|nr:hypothetical protein [Rhodococcus antarcticus]UZJ26989.1 hypothetical protein RHODO2019_18530 [Rhodococcus antarcticus]
MSSDALDGFERWVAATRELISEPMKVRALQDRRLMFAAALGHALTAPHGGDGAAVEGPALYGVVCQGPGLIYVGQTQTAQRRLRDLPIGESHHLANTVPPEVWDRIIVVQWPSLCDVLPAADRRHLRELGDQVVGEALEHLVQVSRAPLLNQRRRGRSGIWTDRDMTGSRGRGAVAAPGITGLFDLVDECWQRLNGIAVPQGLRVELGGRVVVPAALPGPDRR